MIAIKLGISIPTAGMTPSEFWKQVALQRNVADAPPDPTQTAKKVLESLDEPWDTDYVEEDGAAPSVMAYEALYTTLNRVSESAGVAEAAAPDESEEGEDEGLEDLAVEGEVKSEPKPLGIETIVSRIQRGQIDLNPEWQRRYVWPPKKQRRLIESILLGLPIPSLLLFKDEKTGIMHVIDGKQRLQTIANFCAKKGDARFKRFKTFPRSAEGWQPGQPLHEAASKYYENLGPKWKTRVDDTVLQLHVFTELEAEKLYQIFSRYNTGAVQLKAVEIRNAVFQLSKLHRMMWRVAGEHGDDSKYLDAREHDLSQQLREIMRGKVDRYGAYDFMGRYFAFAYQSAGSVAKATYDFMKAHKDDPEEELEELRTEFLLALERVLSWYAYPLVKPKPDGEFHQFLATVQLVSTTRMLEQIEQGTITEATTRERIQAHWAKFAEDTLSIKQNSTNFWTRQKDWIECVQSGNPPVEPKELVKQAESVPA
ncbi:MAG: DUF262 domain-containing protein [Euryarchaeota archaeon]|nr:DUF262 domain-containing protein [Euryarchaeota archaeon]